MTTTNDSFQPVYGTGVTVATSASSASTTFSTPTENVVVTNLSSSVVSYIRIGEGAQTATASDYPVLPNTQVSLSKARSDNTIAYISDGGSGSLHVISGRGM